MYQCRDGNDRKPGSPFVLGQDFSVLGLAIGEEFRTLARRMTRPSIASRLLPAAAPERLLIAPKDLRTADSGLAPEIYSGRFFLAGHMVEAGAVDVFSLKDGPREWQQELQGFGWLRHLEADGSALANENAVALLNDWLAHRFSRRRSVAWDGEVAARRLISWLCHSVPIVEAMTVRQYQQWLKSIGYHIRHLRLSAGQMPEGMARLVVRIALAYAAVCVSGQARSLARAPLLLDRELAAQIDSRGMHLSRNPMIVVDLLCLLLPLRQAHASLGTQPGRELVSSIDRMMAALKFLRLGDGNLARFNGVSVPRTDLVATLLRYDENPAGLIETGQAGGYQRMSAGSTVIIADMARPPRLQFSSGAHAGTLSFELSSEGRLLVVNCGAGAPGAPEQVRRMARATAAHSTAVIADTSSSRVYAGGLFSSLLGGQFVSGPTSVPAEPVREDRMSGLLARHDGYRRPFGVIHERTLLLSRDGNRIGGHDRFVTPSGKPAPDNRSNPYAIRFHLHPSVSAGMAEDGSVLLMCGGGLTWRFRAKQCQPQIEESAFFASASGARRTRQIVLEGTTAAEPEVRWEFAREQLSG